MTENEKIVDRIKKVYSSSTNDQKKYLRQVLEELSESGYSETYNKIWLADYKEIPVDKETFLCDPEYLGSSNNNGRSIYPAWRDVMDELDRTGNQYYEIVFTGATRTGKTSTAVSDASYNLYKLMCLRDPQTYFGLKSVSRISIFFFNLTQTLAKGVAFKEFISTLNSSPWFHKHGHFTKSESNPTYVPEGGQIEITYGSDASHALGKATYCLSGETKILTDMGVYKLSEVPKEAKVGQLTPDRQVVFVKAKVSITSFVSETKKVTLCNGFSIECTGNHKLMREDGSYRCVDELIPSDRLYSIKCGVPSASKIHSIETKNYDKYIPVYDVINAEPYHNFIIAGEYEDYVSHNCVIFDECNFAQAGIKDVNKAKARMKEKYDTLVARVTGTFVKQGEVFGKIYVISSKRSDSDFMEEYVEAQRQAGNKHMYIFDKPQWEVWPSSKYTSSEKFPIALGGKKLKSFVVPDDQNNENGIAELKKQGYEILDVPIDNKTRFLSDFDVALRDIAGITVQGSMTFISQEVLDENITKERKNPFYTDIVQIGTKDDYSLEEFFHIEEVDDRYKKYPMYIHLDLSLNTDKTGISGICQSGRKDIDMPDNKTMSQPTFTHIFSVSLEAPRGDKIPYDKITRFICWLRNQGFYIAGISRDQFQSEYMGQLLEAQGFAVDKLSLDRTPDGYMAFRSILLEHRIDLLNVDLLNHELTRLERDAVTGKVDHRVGESKDISDSVAGSVWNATLKNAPIPVSRKSVASAIGKVNSIGSASRFGGASSPNTFSSIYKNYR